MRRTVLWIGLLAGLAFAACSSSKAESLSEPLPGAGGSQPQGGSAGSSEGGASGQGGGVAAGAGGDSGQGGGLPDASSDAADAGPFTGTWALLLVMTSEMDTALTGHSESENRMIARVQQTHEGEALSIQFHTCDFDIKSSNADVTVIVPDAFVAALPDETLTGTLKAGAMGYELMVPKFWQVRSVQLANPQTDALPTDPKDPRVLDWDKDGHPGMTVTLAGSLAAGDMYIIQRTWTELTGGSTGTDRIDGTVSWEVEQVLLDATNPIIKMMPDPAATTDPAKNYFRHRRIEPWVECSDIIAMQETLFAP